MEIEKQKPNAGGATTTTTTKSKKNSKNETIQANHAENLIMFLFLLAKVDALPRRQRQASNRLSQERLIISH